MSGAANVISKDRARLEAYDTIKKIGRGNFGTVSLVRSKADGKLWVDKTLTLTELSQKDQEGARQEVLMLQALRHPLIVSYKESILVGDSLHIIMEYCSRGDLASKIKQAKEHFPESTVLMIFTQIALAVHFCHQHHIIHRDIKSQNIFITHRRVVKLGDFGIARVLGGTTELATSVVGTPFSMSPEVCESKPYSKPSDVWAMGCVLYEMCMLKHAFDANNLLGLVWKIVQKKPPPIPEKYYSPQLKALIDSMLEKDPRRRPTMRQIIELDIIKPRVEKIINSFRNRQHQQQQQSQANVSASSSPREVQSPSDKKQAILRMTNERRRQASQGHIKTHGNGSVTSVDAAGLSHRQIMILKKKKAQEEKDREYQKMVAKVHQETYQNRLSLRRKQESQFHGQSPITSPKFVNQNQSYPNTPSAGRRRNPNIFASPRAQTAGFPRPQPIRRVSSANAQKASSVRTSHSSQASDPSLNSPQFQKLQYNNFGSREASRVSSPSQCIRPRSLRRTNPHDERPAQASGQYPFEFFSYSIKRNSDQKTTKKPDDGDDEDDFADEGYDIVKEQLDSPASASSSKISRNEIPIVSPKARNKNFQRGIIKEFKDKGLDTKKYDEIYRFIKDRSDSSETVQPEDIREKFGKEYETVATMISKLVVYEGFQTIQQGSQR
uniref:non-specific serine/threonine protein kinase n=2 Tax=Lotharella globosa TaxID=91324 RepID=A0A7S3Z2I9_9EUKA